MAGRCTKCGKISRYKELVAKGSYVVDDNRVATPICPKCGNDQFLSFEIVREEGENED